MTITESHWTDENGVPMGGCSYGTGFTISWQNGPLGRGDKRLEPNGAFIEDVILAAIGRLRYYQSSKFACQENENALAHLESTLEELNSRTKKREARKVEGLAEI